MTTCRWSLLVAGSLVAAAAQAADGAAGDGATIRLPGVPVTASETDDRPPATHGVEVIIDRARLEAANIVTAADALRHAPNLTVRSRYIGDRNAIIGGRAAGTLQSARSLVYADGLLLSDFLDSGFGNPPRWDLVGAAEIDHVEVRYGPYSARLPGNSLGTTVILHTRMPERFEAHAQGQAFVQDFSDRYGTQRSFDGHAWSAGVGNGDGRWSWRIALDRLDNRSQPMQYVIARQVPADDPPRVAEGAVADRNPDGSPRLVIGRGGLDDSRQQLAKLALGFAPGDALSARLTIAAWRNEGRTRAESLLRDQAGEPVHGGTFTFGGQAYRIADGAFSPRRSREEHRLVGLDLDARFGPGWHWRASASRYAFATSRRREAALPPPQAESGGPGTIADADGSGWQTADWHATGPLGNAHRLDMGLHLDRYVLDTRVHDAADWRGPAQGLARAFGGRTRTAAAYVEDEWSFAPDWTATIGLRAESWHAYHGRRTQAGTRLAYPSRSRSALSPKAALAWSFADAWQVRASVGRAVRFPTPGELFQGSISAGAIVDGNPDLEPERDLAADLTLEHAMPHGRWRVSAYRHDLRDSLYTQTDLSVTPTVTNVQNIGRVRVAGIDAEYQRRDFGIAGLDVYASIAFNHSRTLEDRQFPAAQGKAFPRLPRTRASVLLDWRFADRWNASFGARHSGRQYGSLDNRDVVDTFGAVSRYTVFDAKLRFRPAPGWTAALGVDNLTDERYWVYHPWPGRTWYAELRWNAE